MELRTSLFVYRSFPDFQIKQKPILQATKFFLRESNLRVAFRDATCKLRRLHSSAMQILLRRLNSLNISIYFLFSFHFSGELQMHFEPFLSEVTSLTIS